MKNEFLKLLREKENEIIQNSIELINIPSITVNRKECERALRFVIENMKSEGLQTYYTKDMDCGVVELGEGEETLGILTHVDVVDIGDLEKWNTKPFDAQKKDGFIIGRGAVDDKCPTVIIMTILNVLNSLNLKYKRKVQFIVGTSEEEEWTDIKSYKNEFTPPNFGFTPDGEFPVYNIESGYADVILEFVVDTDTNFGIVKVMESGNSSNTIPSAGTLQIIKKGQDFHFDFKGKSSHSSLPENGNNALIKMCKWLVENSEMDTSLKNAIDLILLMDNCYYGDTLGFDNLDLYINEDYIGKNIVNPTILKLEGNKLTLNINIRQRFGVTKDDINKVFKKLSDEYEFDYRFTGGFLDPLYVNSNNPVFEKMNTVYEEVTKNKGGFQLTRGTSYAKALPNSVCWGPLLEGEEDTCHQENEKMSVESIIKCVEIYGSFIYDMLVE
ncbi:MAG: M20/M25/M40 family metallo-hydrolase [Gudongella sp.]|nr:M20/M25/M40 family metallo-hydrolase [Gudongella sp.]